MTKEELIKAIATDSKVDAKMVEKVLKGLANTVKETVLVKGDPINIYGLGTFKQVNTAAKQARNPKTGEALTIPARTKVRFKAALALSGKVK